MAWGARHCAASVTSATVRSHSSALWSVATRKWCHSSYSPQARYNPSKALRISAGGGEASVQSRSHGSAPRCYLPAPPCQMVAGRARRSLHRTLAIGCRQG